MLLKLLVQMAISTTPQIKVVHKLKSHYGKKTRDLTPKYRNPFNYSETWSGFGHRPQWLKNGLSENKFTLEQCKIKN